MKLDYTTALERSIHRGRDRETRNTHLHLIENMASVPGMIGNVFSPLQIDKAIELGEQYKGIPTNDYTLHSVGVDFGFGSSSTAVVLTEFLKEEHKIRVLYAEEFEHANPQDIVDLCFNLYRKHWNTWFFVDGANRAAVNLMKVAFGESLNWENSKTGS